MACRDWEEEMLPRRLLQISLRVSVTRLCAASVALLGGQMSVAPTEEVAALIARQDGHWGAEGKGSSGSRLHGV